MRLIALTLVFLLSLSASAATQAVANFNTFHKKRDKSSTVGVYITGEGYSGAIEMSVDGGATWSVASFFTPEQREIRVRHSWDVGEPAFMIRVRAWIGNGPIRKTRNITVKNPLG